MKLYAHQQKRLKNLEIKWRKSIKGKTKNWRDKLTAEYKEVKRKLLLQFKTENSIKQAEREVKKEIKEAKKEAVENGLPYLKKTIKSGFYDLYELKTEKNIEQNTSKVDQFIKNLILKDTTEQIRYIHIIITYQDDLWGVESIFSDAFTRLKCEILLNENKSVFELLLNKAINMQRQKESDFNIDKIKKILVKVIYNEGQTNEASNTQKG